MTPEIIAYIDRSGNLRPGDCPLRSDLEPLVRLSDVLALLPKSRGKFIGEYVGVNGITRLYEDPPVGEATDSDMGADALQEAK